MPGAASKLEKSRVVWLILNQRADEALTLLAKHYKTSTPRLKVGLPKGNRKNISGCYAAKNATISVLDSDTLGNPFVIIHEFYHHMRTSIDKKHKGTERNADQSALEFLKEYQATNGQSAF